MICVYSILHRESGKRYVGSTVNHRKRWTNHRHLLNKGTHKTTHLQHAWNKYGEDAFDFVVLEELADNTNIIAREQYWLDKLNPEYNVLALAYSHTGYRHTEENKRRCGMANSEYKHTEEHKNKIKNSLIGHMVSEETKEKLRKANTGYKHTDEARVKMSESAKKRWSKK